MATPQKSEIEAKAIELFFKDQHQKGFKTSLTPTMEELKESGYWNRSKNELMRNEENLYLDYLEKEARSLGYVLKKEDEAYLKICLKTNMFEIPFDAKEATRTNTLISGTNATGKSRLACAICSILRRFNWRIVVFDNSGIYREISDIPFIHTIEGNTLPIVRDVSLIYDISFLSPKFQRKLVDAYLEDLWKITRRTPKENRKQTLVVLEEFEIFGKSARFSDNLHRILHVGRNLRIRVLAVTTDLALIDPSFIRLCQQRYHARLGIEENSKRKFRAYYGSDWTRVATEGLGLGDFIYLNQNKLRVVHIPLFEPTILPKPVFERAIA